MERLHNTIRVDFNLEAFQRAMSLEKFWAIITAYIDHLHALELLIVEELECYRRDEGCSADGLIDYDCDTSESSYALSPMNLASMTTTVSPPRRIALSPRTGP